MDRGGPSTQRRAIGAVAALTFLGALVRLWAFGEVGLQHFDEGNYALAGCWITLPGGLGAIDPDTLSYAPPGMLVLTGCTYALLGISDQTAILISVIAGVAAIPLTAVLAGRAFGPVAAVAAAALAALSGPHFVYSRTALTDALFLTGWLAAVVAGGWFLERPGPVRSLVFGVAVGLAQNLKYNGALVGLLVALAALPAAIRRRGPDGTRPIRLLVLLALAAAVAALVYWPWFRFVEAHGGYGRLVAHHRGYVDGLAAWPANARVQLAQAVALSGGAWWLVPAWALAGLAGRAVAPRIAGYTPVRTVGLLVLGGLVLAVLPEAPWWLGLVLLSGLLRSDRPALRLVGTWWIFFSLILPLYRPYARLALPLHAVGWVLAGGLMARFLTGPEPELRVSWTRRAGIAVTVLAALVLHFGTGPRPRALATLRTPTASLRKGLRAHITAPPPGGGVLRMLARPPAIFYLGVWNNTPFAFYQNVDNLLGEADAAAGDLVLIDGALLRQEPDPAAAWARLSTAWEPDPDGRWTEVLGPATWLDLDPRAAMGDRSRATVTWWRMRPRAPARAPNGPPSRAESDR